jgi:cytochrome c oxidase subunit 5b
MRVEDVMPIATGHEREEIEAELQVRLPLYAPLALSLVTFFFGSILVLIPVWLRLQGKKRFDMDAPVGPFGTKVSAFHLTASDMII